MNENEDLEITQLTDIQMQPYILLPLSIKMALPFAHFIQFLYIK
jgi:hypothetical protein